MDIEGSLRHLFFLELRLEFLLGFLDLFLGLSPQFLSPLINLLAPEGRILPPAFGLVDWRLVLAGVCVGKGSLLVLCGIGAVI